jgi:deoxyribonuclease-2
VINNEVVMYGSHFGSDLKEMYPNLYNATLSHSHHKTDNDGVRLQALQSIKGFKFLSVSKNRYFGKDLYEDLITNLTKSNLYTETWLNSKDTFNSSCSNQYKTMNILSLSMKHIKELENCSYNSHKDHSKWVITGKSSTPWTCIGDINRASHQTQRGGGTVCIDSIKIWSQFKKLVSTIEKCA